MNGSIHGMQRGGVLVVALLGCAVLLPAQAGDGLQLSTGADYSSGDFGGTTSTDVLVVPISARLRLGGWSLRGTLPYLRISGPADVIVIADDSGGSSGGSSGSSSSGSGRGRGRGGDTPTPGTDDSGNDCGSGNGSDDRGGNDSFSDGRQVSGVGDATLSLTRSFNNLAGTPFYGDVIGRVKFATGKAATGLGVGAADYSAGSELGYVGKAGGLYASAARRFLGSTASLQRVDGWQWNAGGWVNVGAAVELGAVYSWREASVPLGVDSRSVELNLGLLLGRDWQASLFASRGLSDGSPSYAGGLSLSWQYRL